MAESPPSAGDASPISDGVFGNGNTTAEATPTINVTQDNNDGQDQKAVDNVLYSDVRFCLE